MACICNARAWGTFLQFLRTRVDTQGKHFLICVVITSYPGKLRINYFSLTQTNICLPRTPFIKTAIESRIEPIVIKPK